MMKTMTLGKTIIVQNRGWVAGGTIAAGLFFSMVGTTTRQMSNIEVYHGTTGRRNS